MILFGPISLSPSDWLDWKKSPVTQEILSALTREREEWLNRLVGGDTLITGREAVETARAVGVIYGLDCMLIGIEEVLREQWEERSGEGN